jgi:anti-sigma regulatory factor (Ser/Thr protein kinase)
VQLDVAGPEHDVALSNGGHPPPLLVRAGGEVEEVARKGGMLLGIYSNAELVDQRVELLPGDALVMFTDGLAERRNPDEDPAGRIRELLRAGAGAGANASETATSLGQLALSDGVEPDDDVAVVVLRRLRSRENNGAGTARAPSESLAVELKPGPRCPAEARAALSPLADVLPIQAHLDVCLLVSELVTNSVRHARLRPRELIRLRVETSDRVVRVEVSDPGEGFGASASEPAARGPGGWGLFLTERLADRWGVDRESGWTMVWLELDLEAPGPLPG